MDRNEYYNEINQKIESNDLEGILKFYNLSEDGNVTKEFDNEHVKDSVDELMRLLGSLVGKKIIPEEEKNHVYKSTKLILSNMYVLDDEFKEIDKQ